MLTADWIVTPCDTKRRDGPVIKNHSFGTRSRIFSNASMLIDSIYEFSLAVKKLHCWIASDLTAGSVINDEDFHPRRSSCGPWTSCSNDQIRTFRKLNRACLDGLWSGDCEQTQRRCCHNCRQEESTALSHSLSPLILHKASCLNTPSRQCKVAYLSRRVSDTNNLRYVEPYFAVENIQLRAHRIP